MGERTDTDLISGCEAGLRTVLLGGSTRSERIDIILYRRMIVMDSIADVVPLVKLLPT